MILLIIVLAGVVDLGRVFSAYIVITNSAREAARYGVKAPTDTNGIVNRAIQEAQNSGVNLVPGDVEVTAGSTGEPIEVGIRYYVPLIVGEVLGASPLEITTSVKMIVF
jgi:Flp pilus assembly protein TadG